MSSFFFHVACIPVKAGLSLVLLSLSHFLRSRALAAAEACGADEGSWALESDRPSSGWPQEHYVVLWAQSPSLENRNDKIFTLFTLSKDVKDAHLFRNNIESLKTLTRSAGFYPYHSNPPTSTAQGLAERPFSWVWRSIYQGGLCQSLRVPPGPSSYCPSVFPLSTATYGTFSSWCQQKPHSPLCPSDTMKMAASTSVQLDQLQLWSPFPF